MSEGEVGGLVAAAAVRFGVECRAIGPGHDELGFLGLALRKMQSEAARWSGEPAGEREEPSPKGLGGYQLLTQTDAHCPAGQVMRHHLDGQPGGVGGETARGQVVQPDAVLEVADGILDLGVAAMVGLQFQGFPVSVGDETVIAVVDEEGALPQIRRYRKERFT